MKIQLNDTTLKLASHVDRSHPFGGNRKGSTTTLTINGVVVATVEVSMDAFCSIKNGVRSRIRDKYKLATRVRWVHTALEQVLGTDTYKKLNRKVEGPDLSWGFAGERLTLKGLAERILATATVTA